MTEVLTAGQMRRIETAAIETAAIHGGDVTGLELMERAGRGVVGAIFAQWPDLAATTQRAVVLCGPGNNGGDGYVVARLLQEWGWDLRVVALGASVSPDARAMRAKWEDIGGVVAPGAVDWPDFQGAAVVVDAMFGSGLARDIAPGVWGLLAMARNMSISPREKMATTGMIVHLHEQTCKQSRTNRQKSHDNWRNI